MGSFDFFEVIRTQSLTQCSSSGNRKDITFVSLVTGLNGYFVAEINVCVVRDAIPSPFRGETDYTPSFPLGAYFQDSQE